MNNHINKFDVLIETAKRNWGIKHSSIYFHTNKPCKIYFKYKQLEGNSLGENALAIESINTPNIERFYFEINNEIPINLISGKSFISNKFIKVRFPIPGIYRILFHFKKNENEQIIIPLRKTLSDETRQGEPISANSYTGIATIIVLDFFSYQVTVLTRWILGLTAFLIILTFKLLNWI